MSDDIEIKSAPGVECPGWTIGRNGLWDITGVCTRGLYGDYVKIAGIGKRGTAIERAGIVLQRDMMDQLAASWLARKFPLVVEKWIDFGELLVAHEDTDQAMHECGILLDRACSHEIIGPATFKGADGKYYRVHIEAVIDEVDESDVRGEYPEAFENAA